MKKTKKNKKTDSRERKGWLKLKMLEEKSSNHILLSIIVKYTVLIKITYLKTLPI
jgi:hypothetical protein